MPPCRRAPPGCSSILRKIRPSAAPPRDVEAIWLPPVPAEAAAIAKQAWAELVQARKANEEAVALLEGLLNRAGAGAEG
jgi:hypothetical protein